MRIERKMIRENDPLIISSAGNVANSEPLIPISYIILPDNDSISIQASPKPIDVACQTTFN